MIKIVDEKAMKVAIFKELKVKVMTVEFIECENRDFMEVCEVLQISRAYNNRGTFY